MKNMIWGIIDTQMAPVLFCTYTWMYDYLSISSQHYSLYWMPSKWEVMWHLPPVLETLPECNLVGQKDELSDFLSVAGYGNGACLLPVL